MRFRSSSLGDDILSLPARPGGLALFTPPLIARCEANAKRHPALLPGRLAQVPLGLAIAG
jgi:hypothetical protein